MKPKQKTLLSVFMIIFCILLSGISVFAEDGMEDVEILVSGDYSYFVINGGATLVDYTNFTETVITIPQEIDGYPVKALGKNLFYKVSDDDNTISKVIAEKFIIPESVEEVGAFAFYGCVNVKEYEVSKDNDSFFDLDGVMFDKDMSMIIAYPIGSEVTEYTVPNGVSFIDYGVFSNSKLEKIVLPESLVLIGEWAFAKSTELKEVTLPNYLDKVSKYAFAYCTALTDIKWSTSLITLEKGAFGGCTSLTEITLPDSLKEIGQGAFSDCTSIREVILPEGLNILNEGAFSGCTSLNEIELPSKLIVIGENAVGYNYNISKELVRNANFKIHGKTGSNAEAYASENKFTFISTGVVEQQTSPPDTTEDEGKVSTLASEDGKSDEMPITLIVVILVVGGLAVITTLVIIVRTKKKKA